MTSPTPRRSSSCVHCLRERHECTWRKALRKLAQELRFVHFPTGHVYVVGCRSCATRAAGAVCAMEIEFLVGSHRERLFISNDYPSAKASGIFRIRRK